ncbi:MAG: hypothetical protein COB53_03010 [Elusimicrobia bacterium]|nr:MAG: hypothetical protein COB53_03010 [Elusimicrobiota bacterium]
MGTAVGGAIGGKLGAPERPVIAICGDGGFAMTGMEVLTATTYNIPVIWIVFNDGRFNTVHHGMQMQYEGRTNATEFRQIDIIGIARALGARAETVCAPGQISSAMRSAIAANVPTIIEVLVDRDEPPPIRSRVESLNRFFAEANEDLCQF